jgi:hypothetical protein
VQIARGLIIVCSALLFMTALKYLPLADRRAHDEQDRRRRDARRLHQSTLPASRTRIGSA